MSHQEADLGPATAAEAEAERLVKSAYQDVAIQDPNLDRVFAAAARRRWLTAGGSVAAVAALGAFAFTSLAGPQTLSDPSPANAPAQAALQAPTPLPCDNMIEETFLREQGAAGAADPVASATDYLATAEGAVLGDHNQSEAWVTANSDGAPTALVHVVNTADGWFVDSISRCPS